MTVNNSGIEPVGDRVVIKAEPIEEKTSGGILIPDPERAKHGNSQVFGHIVAIGPDAWSDYSEPFAKVGDRVIFAKFGGLFVDGEDGEEYRIFNDVDVTARVSDGVRYAGLEPRKKKYGH
jgi:chaperonin GroES